MFLWVVSLFTCGSILKFIYSEKAAKFCEISSLLLTVCTVVKGKVEISPNFVVFLEFMNFNTAYNADSMNIKRNLSFNVVHGLLS